MKKNAKVSIVFAILAIALLALSACQPAAETTEAPAAEAPAQEAPAEEAPTEEAPVEEAPAEEAPAETSKVGGTLIYAFNQEPDSLDPAVTGAAVSDIVLGTIGCSLVTYDDEGTVVPYIAESWEVSEDGLTYTFHLRDDAKFSNGKPVTAQDFAFEYLRALDPDTASQSTGPQLGNVTSITAIDDYTLEIVLGAPNYPFLLSIGDPGYMQPVNQEDFETMGADAFARGPVGCGPYKIASWETGSKITVVRNPDYNWGPADVFENTGPWNIETIEFRIIPEAATILAGLENGEIGIANITTIDKQYLETLDEVNIEGYLQPGLRPYLAINVAHAPFDDLNVRKAFNMAINREAAVQILAQGDGQVQYGPLSPAQIGYNPAVEGIGYTYDPDGAAALLEESGYAKDADGFWGKDGQRISLTLYTLPVDSWIKTAELMQQQYDQFGLELTIEQSEQGVLTPIILGGVYDISVFGMTYPEADIMWLMFHSSQIGGFNYAGVNDPVLDEILDRTRTEIDPAARQAAVDEAQTYIVEQAYLIPIYIPINYMAVNSSIKDYRFSDIRLFDLDSAYIEE